MDKLFRKVKRTVNTLKAQPLEVSLQSVPVVKGLYMRLVETLQDKDKQLQSLTRAYLGAFTIIGIISILGHVATYYITAGMKENAEVTFTIIKMRSLVDTVQSQASAFKASGNSFDDDRLTSSINELKTECTKTEVYGSEAMNKIFHTAPYLLNDRIKTFMVRSEEFARHKRKQEGPETMASFEVLTGQDTKMLDINLDLALDQYRADVLKEIDRSSNMQEIGVGIILLVLLMEGGFIFRPLVNHLREYHKYLIKLALTDMLTNLNNRRAFMQLANAGLDYYNRHKTPFVLVLMDLDHFKKVNDTYGHKVGDLVLQHYSAILQKGLRAHDTVGRIGGEEFAIFLPQTTAEEAMPMIERVRIKVAETACSYMDGNGQPQKLHYSSSFGAVAVTEGAWTLDDLFIRADEQLYKAKEQGRNCVVMKKV